MKVSEQIDEGIYRLKKQGHRPALIRLGWEHAKLLRLESVPGVMHHDVTDETYRGIPLEVVHHGAGVWVEAER